MKKLSFILVTILALGLSFGACGGGGSTSPNAQSVAPKVKTYRAPATATTTPPAKSDAVVIAKRLGCINPGLRDTSGDMKIGPQPTQSVDCTVGTTEFKVDVYADHDGAHFFLSPSGKAMGCSILKSFGVTGPIYVVMGDDFTASAQYVGTSKGTVEQAKALGAALGLGATTVNC